MRIIFLGSILIATNWMNSNGLAGIQNKWFHGKIWENIFEVCSPESTSTGWLRLFCRSKFGRQKLLAKTLAIPIIYKGLLYYLRPTTSPKSVSYIFLWCNVQAPRLDRGARNIWRVVSSPFLRLGSHTTKSVHFENILSKIGFLPVARFSCIDKYWFLEKWPTLRDSGDQITWPI